MLTKLKIRNFKTFDDVEIELGQTTVFVGPNNSGKTTALQALMLWYVGIIKLFAGNFHEKTNIRNITRVGEMDVSSEVFGTTINRLDLTGISTSHAKMLWKSLRVKNRLSINIFIDVEGVSNGSSWNCGLRFLFGDSESIDYGPSQISEDNKFVLPIESSQTPIVFLPPMSGLAATEKLIQRDAINQLVGEGRTSEVLRNICYSVYEGKTYWQNIVDHIRRMFGVEILPPQYREYLAGRPEIRMSYLESNGSELDISTAGRGMLQMLLLLVYLYDNPGTVLLLDEPDAHLEILRQREVYQLLTDITREMGSQLIVATHSEVIMDEAGETDVLIAFVGKPHRIDDRNSRSQVLKALREIRFDDYYQAIQTGWVLYLEDSTDLRILQQFAQTLRHERAMVALERPFVWYVKSNHPPKAREHFFALREAKSDLGGLCLFDRLERALSENEYLKTIMWQKREIENYLCLPETLEAYARQFPNGESAMQGEIAKLETAFHVLNRPSIFSSDVKASDDVLVPLFKNFFGTIGQYNIMEKSNFHVLAQYVPVDKIDPEVIEKLDAIVKVAESAQPGDAS